MKKQNYQAPEMEIVRFGTEDIIRTSGINNETGIDLVGPNVVNGIDLNTGIDYNKIP